jgi:hypothetical protein
MSYGCGSGFSAVVAIGYYGEVGPAAMIEAGGLSHVLQVTSNEHLMKTVHGARLTEKKKPYRP